MKKIVINIISSIFFSISIVLVIFCLTLLNNNFVIKQFERNDYYQLICDDIKNENIKLNYSKNNIKKDVNKYIKSGYKDNYTTSLSGNKEVLRKYNNQIKFLNFKYSFIKLKIVSYIITFILIIITGNILLKTKKLHDINFIFIISSILGIILSGIISIFVDLNNIILNNIVIDGNHLLLAVYIILLEIGLYNKIKARFIK